MPRRVAFRTSRKQLIVAAPESSSYQIGESWLDLCSSRHLGALMTHPARHSRCLAPTIGPSVTMTDAAKMMCELGVDALVVVRPTDGKILCTITDRDIVCFTAQE